MRDKFKIILASLLAFLMVNQAYGNTPADSVKVLCRILSTNFYPSTEESRKATNNCFGFLCKVNDYDRSASFNPTHTSKKFAEVHSTNQSVISDSTQWEFLSESTMPHPFFMDVKTNMLYDVALVPNLGAEFYLGKNLSLYGEWMYAWWTNNQRHRYWRIYGGDLGLRWWFGAKAHAKPLTGHHLGVYAGALMFDFECGGTGYMGGKPGATLWDRCLINSGIEYGYSLPIGTHLNIDLSIGVGYLGGNYIKYYPFDNDYYSKKEYKMRYFGPTKAEVSLIWLIGRSNVNTKKGGDE